VNDERDGVMTKRESVVSVMLVSMALLPTIAGCVGETGGDGQEGAGGVVSVVTSGLQYDECRRSSVVPDFTTAWEINWTTPRTYFNPNCTGAIVADLNTLSVQFLQTGTAHNAGIQITYADNDLTTPAACHDTTVHVILYRKSGSLWPAIEQAVSGGGTWISGPLFSFCSPPSIFIDGHLNLVSHANYRIAAVAKRFFSGETRKVNIATVYAENQPG
jgi:hypothetical protein